MAVNKRMLPRPQFDCGREVIWEGNMGGVLPLENLAFILWTFSAIIIVIKYQRSAI